MMPIRGLFNRSENNDEEMEKLTKRVQTLEQQVKKINTLDVHMKRLLKLESKWKKETLFSSNDKIEKKKTRQGPEKAEPKSRESNTAMEKHFFLQLSRFISQMLAPIQTKIDNLEGQIAVMKKNFSLIEESIEENRERMLELKDELENMKTNSFQEIDPVVIREIRVDRILLDKYEQNNNFGNLGIKDLSGQLNIGATYGTSTLPAEIAGDLKGTFDNFKQEKESDDMEEAAEESQEEAGYESGWQSSEESSGESSNGQNRTIEDDDDFTEVPIE